jgi:hypothetical protein
MVKEIFLHTKKFYFPKETYIFFQNFTLILAERAYSHWTSRHKPEIPAHGRLRQEEDHIPTLIETLSPKLNNKNMDRFSFNLMYIIWHAASRKPYCILVRR